MAAAAEKTVCIVGVAGFIGSHLLEKIIRERSWNVIGIDMVAPNKIQQLLGAEVPAPAPWGEVYWWDEEE